MDTHNPEARVGLGARCKQKREDAGFTSCEHVRDVLLTFLPRRYVPTSKTLYRIEAGRTPEEKVDGILIYGLARVYECRISDLSPLVAAEADELDMLLKSSSPWITGIPGQGKLFQSTDVLADAA